MEIGARAPDVTRDRDFSPQERDVVRWEAWLRRTFPASHIARSRDRLDGSGDAVWHVEFQDGKLGRIYVSDEALRLEDREFETLTTRLNEMDWYSYLDRLLCIRIGCRGGITQVQGI